METSRTTKKLKIPPFAIYFNATAKESGCSLDVKDSEGQVLYCLVLPLGTETKKVPISNDAYSLDVKGEVEIEFETVKVEGTRTIQIPPDKSRLSSFASEHDSSIRVKNSKGEVLWSIYLPSVACLRRAPLPEGAF